MLVFKKSTKKDRTLTTIPIVTKNSGKLEHLLTTLRIITMPLITTTMPSIPIDFSHITLNLIYDKLTFTLPINIDERLNLINRINDPEFYQDYNRKVYNSKAGRYKNNYQFTIYKGNTIEVSLYPINTKHNFLRIEYNPNKLGRNGRIKLRKFLIKLLGFDKVKEIYFEARITRLDLTLDVYGLKSDYYIQKPKVQKSAIYSNADGSISSQILGSDNSPCRITMYDKVVEQATKGKKAKSSSTNYQRVEVRLRDLDYTMAELGLNKDLLDKIKKVDFYHKLFLKDARFSKKFKAYAQEKGLNAVFKKLRKIDHNEARRYSRYLENYQVLPICFDNLSFKDTHKAAVGSLLHCDYSNRLVNFNLDPDP